MVYRHRWYTQHSDMDSAADVLRSLPQVIKLSISANFNQEYLQPKILDLMLKYLNDKSKLKYIV